MIKLKFFISIILLSTFNSFSQNDSLTKKETLVWQTDLKKANEISKATNKPIFALFTGSDWCFWCKKLQKDVIEKAEFIKWANKNVVLLELDFPRGKQLSPEQVQQNNSLQQTFQVQGYPTIHMFFLKQDEKANKFDIGQIGSLGYPAGSEPGKEEVKFLNDADLLLQKGAAK